MPMYDRVCPNNHEMLDCWEPIEAPDVLCKTCNKLTERAWIGKPAAVIGDDIPGGLWVRHGLCDPETGAPRKYYSKSEMAAEAKARGLVNIVEHVGERGSDKSKHTTRWTGISTISEEERVKAWHVHEAALTKEADNKQEA